jgi:hypothetical protein
MGKQVSDTQAPSKDLPSKSLPSPSSTKYSFALQRVLSHLGKNGTSELRGIYLSNRQIVNLGNALKKMKRENDGPDGMCFMVGEIDSGVRHLTVEMIPFKKDKKDDPIKFYKENNVIGGLSEINLGKPFDNGFEEFKIDGNGVVHEDDDHEEEHKPGDVVPIPNHISGQHTPPPFE